MARRPKGSGSIFQRTDGRWCGQLKTNGHSYSVYGKTKSEAQAKLKQLQGEANRHTLRPPSHLTVGEYLDWWLATVEPQLKPTTHRSYVELATLHLKPEVGATKLEKLAPTQLSRLYADKLRAGLSPRRVGMIHSTIRKALNDAVRLELIGQNPALKVDPPRVERIEPRLWTDAEMARFIAHQQQKPRRWDWLWLFLLGSGCRLGEALGLEWKNIDLDGRAVEIRQAVVYVQGKPQLSTPKTKASKRTLALPELAMRALREQRRVVGADRLRAGADWPGGEFVFLTATGHHPTQQSNLRRDFRAACQRAGVPALRIHDLRHLHCSVLAGAGVDLKSAQKRMGHSSFATTAGIYAHVLNQTDRALADELDRKLGKTGAIGR